jgi:glyoxylase-like metal-dependent hydrolase (beta-lactamase superfamily II)
MATYLQQLERLKALRPRLRSIAPGHGHLIEQPVAKIDEYLAHRAMREQQIVDLLRADGPITVDAIVAELYPETPEELLPMAAGTVWAHLRKLKHEGLAKGTRPDRTWSAA